VRVFFDEDMGRGIPEALRGVGLGEPPNSVTYLRKVYGRKSIIPDEKWIPWAAQNDYVAFSCNTGILNATAQRELVISTGLGIVFLTTGQEKSVEVLKLILRKWAWLETIVQKEPRPFAYLMTIGGTTRRDPRV